MINKMGFRVQILAVVLVLSGFFRGKWIMMLPACLCCTNLKTRGVWEGRGGGDVVIPCGPGNTNEWHQLKCQVIVPGGWGGGK